MKIAIISDVHNNIANLEKVLKYCRESKIDRIICCGDLASKETLDFLCDNFQGEILSVLGNMDNDQMRVEFSDKKPTGKKSVLYKNAEIFSDFGEFEVMKNRCAFVHFPDVAEKLCLTGKYDFVFYGHTHKPWEEKTNNCLMLNPGNVANEIFAPTFAVWDVELNKFDLCRIDAL